MTDKENIITEQPTEEVDYIAAIQQLQNNTVSKDQYQKLRDENKKLLDALVSGQQINVPAEEPVDIGQLRQKLYNPDNDISNLEYIQNTLKLRKAIMDQGGQDPFLGIGSHVDITQEMRDKAQRVADGLQYCVDFAEGDSGIFSAQYQRMTKDTLIPKR